MNHADTASGDIMSGAGFLNAYVSGETRRELQMDALSQRMHMSRAKRAENWLPGESNDN